jgi:hypothetical protein
LGYWIARQIGLRASIVIAVATELLMLLWIRDNLTLNVLMLLSPLDALRRWQAGG